MRGTYSQICPVLSAAGVKLHSVLLSHLFHLSLTSLNSVDSAYESSKFKAQYMQRKLKVLHVTAEENADLYPSLLTFRCCHTSAK